jgi:hypothetical protein
MDEPMHWDDKSDLQKALSVKFVGEWIALGLFVAPAFVLGIVFALFGVTVTLAGWQLSVVAAITAIWLKVLEEEARVQLTTPLLPIPLRWLAVGAIGWGLLQMIGCAAT